MAKTPNQRGGAEGEAETNTKVKKSFILSFLCLGLLFLAERMEDRKFNVILSSTLKSLVRENDSTRTLSTVDHILRDTEADNRLKKHYKAMGFHLLEQPQYRLNDPTMRLSPYVDRPWLQYGSDLFPEEAKKYRTKPKTKLVLTDFGWNHPDKKKGLAEFTRGLRSRELLQAFIDHPLFDPTFRWTDMMEGKVSFDTSIQYFVMMDIETCFESNYPKGTGNYLHNADTQQGRLVSEKGQNPCYRIGLCSRYIDPILQSPLFQQVNASTLLYFECGGSGPAHWYWKKADSSPQLTLLSYSSGPNQISDDWDMGMPPPAVNPVSLTAKERQAIDTCESESTENRPYLLSFVGSYRRGSPRDALFELHNGEDVFLMRTSEFRGKHVHNPNSNITFAGLLRKATFAAAPRGDNRFSYRFTEVMSAGAIPVIHSDGWILPFRKELVDWSKCAVVIPEINMNQTIHILRNISTAERCRMRQYCYDIYLKYMVNPEANIAGVLDSIEARDELSMNLTVMRHHRTLFRHRRH